MLTSNATSSKTQPDTQLAFAEVVESALHSWKAQCWHWDTVPHFGELVTITAAKRTIFGIVHQIETGSSDPHRLPFAYQKTEEDLLREQPQIFAFLQTTFSCITVGFAENNHLWYQWVPQPPKIHAFVASATPEHYAQFFESDQYLNILFGLSQTISQPDELILAILNRMAEQKLLSPERFSLFIESFSLLTGNDYRRLKLFLQRVDSLLSLSRQKATPVTNTKNAVK